MTMHSLPPNRYLSRGGLCATLCGATLLLAPLVYSQDDEAEEIFELSPFEVTGDDEQGYQAVDTLAGNRLNTELRDVGSAISVVTTQFLDDVGATDNKSLLQYTVGTEVGSVEGNFAGLGDGGLLDERSNLVNPSANTRVRGLTNADNSRDYFISDIPWDGYNIDRVELQRGPNSILFGQGSPAGLINVGLQGAAFADEGKVDIKFDQHGTTRYSLNYNKAILEDELAVRIATLYDDEKYKQDPAFNRDIRLYLALRYDPSFMNGDSVRTTFKANYESGEIDSNNPRSIPPVDAITPWFRTGTYQGGYSFNESTQQYEASKTYNYLNQETFNPYQLQDDNTGRANHGQQRPAINGGPRTGQANPAYNPWLGSFANGQGDPLGYFSSPNAAPTYVLPERREIRSITTEGVVDRSQGITQFHRNAAVNGYSSFARLAGLPYSEFGVHKNYNLTDPSIFDFYNKLIDGPAKGEWQEFDSYNLNLSQTYLEDKIGWEIAHNSQSYDNGQLSLLTGGNQAINIDVMSVYADGTPDGLDGEPYQDGTPNPNVGRPFISDDGAGGNNSFNSERSSSRLTLFGTYDFNDKGDGAWWRKLLGRNTFTGLLAEDKRDTDSRSWVRWAILDPQYREFVGAQDSEDFNAFHFIPNPVVYLGPTLAGRSSATGAGLPSNSAPISMSGGTISAFDSTWKWPLDPSDPNYVDPAAEWISNYFLPPSLDDPGNADAEDRRLETQNLNPANYVGWVDYPFTVTDSEDGNRDLLTTSAGLDNSKVTSKALVWQGHLWDGALVGTWGIREDKAEGWSVSRNTNSAAQYTYDYGHIDLSPEVYNIESEDVLYSSITETSKSWSVVAHLNEFMDDKLPVNVSLFYNNSRNFQPEAARVDVYGEPIPLPQGDTVDMGILVASKDNRYSVRINKYETEVTAANSSGLGGAWFLGASQAWSANWVNHFEFDWTGDTPADAVADPDPEDSQYNYGLAEGETLADAQAREAAAIAAWRTWQAEVDPRFYEAWNVNLDAPFDATSPQGVGSTVPNGFQLTEDSVSKGYEIEVSARPTDNWNIMLNATQTKATRRNIGGENLAAFVAAYTDTLENTAAGDLRIWWGGAGNETALYQWNTNVNSEWTSRKLQEGTNAPELREWRVNMITNYAFTDGKFKGFNVGGGARWQDQVVIGYRPLLDDDGGVTFDIDNPYWGPDEINLDLWVGYEKAISDKVDWSIQVNVRNAFDGERLIPITTQPDGTPAGYRVAPSEVWSLTNSFKF